MEQDWLGNPITAGSAATLAGINAFVEGFLAYETRATQVLGAAEADPDCALANAYAAAAWLFLESPEGPRKAGPYLARAEVAARGATERERAVVAAIRAWAEGNIPRALALGESITAAHPRDLATYKLTQYHHFNLGDAPGMLRIARNVLPASRDVPYAHGLAAFAYEQCHMLSEAEEAALAAMRLKRAEPWAHHALAHVHLTQGRITEGRAFLQEMAPSWAGLNSFMRTHNWWHLALFMIEQGEGEGVLEFYADQIWGVWKEYSQDQIGAIALLARLELAGIDVGSRWQDVASHVAPRIHEHVQPFLDLHYIYGLARAGRAEADAMLESIRAFATGAPAFVRGAWTEVALPAAAALLAHARGAYAEAARLLLPVLPRMAEIGGSHAQRDLFVRIADDSRMRGGHPVAAQQRLEQRRQAQLGRCEPGFGGAAGASR